MIKQLLVAISLIFITAGTCLAQCEETDENKVLLVGDSWAFFMGVDQTFNDVFEQWGHSNYKYYTNAILSENGAETVDFMQPEKQAEIQAQLDAQPSIEVVHLSLGGNDVLGNWNVNFTQLQTDSLIDTVLTRLITIIDFIKEARPGIKIVWSGYTYTNFGQVLADAGPLAAIHPFNATWQGMGTPTFIQLNQVQNEVSSIVEAIVALDPQLEYISANGLMQHTFGQATNLSVPPGGSYPPFTSPLPVGYPDYPSPKSSMRNYGLFLDCFHLSAIGFRDFISFQSQKFYQKFLMGDQYLFSTGGTQDGSVNAAGEVAPNQLYVGQLLNEVARPIITFNTTTLPDAGVSSASLFLRRESLIGANPINQDLQIKISNGFIGTSIDIEPADFNANANATVTPCNFGSTSQDGHWIRIDLPEVVLPIIDNSSTIQIMLVASEEPQGLMSFSNADDLEFAPVLSVNHNVVTAVSENILTDRFINIYPNPTTDKVFIDNKGIAVKSVQVFNLDGQLVLLESANASSVDFINLPAGVYLIKVITNEGSVVKRVVRR
jgi:hypothetical protein